jgi:hypothetical protein
MKSTLIPWLFFGPLFGMMGAYLLWTLSHWNPAKWCALACLAWVVLFAVTALLANLRRRSNPKE